jgi:DNA-binding NarL/FixJ family response regulator
MQEPLRILVADDHEMIRKGLRSLINPREDWHLCGEATNGREAVEMARQLRPNVIIMDVTMPELNGLDATRQILRELPDCRVLILTMHESEQLIHEVLAAGASGYVLKSDAGNLVVAALESLSRHQPFFTSKVSEMLLREYHSPRPRGDAGGDSRDLTPREREIVQLIAEGKSGKEIASILSISTKTVETHRTNLMRKLGIHSISEIVRYAIRNNIVEA